MGRQIFFLVSVLLLVMVFACFVVQAKEISASNKHNNTSNSKLHVQSRAENSKKHSEKSNSDMQSVLQQHLIGPGFSAPASNNENEYRGKEEGKKGRLQMVGSVLGDIIGVLISEVARFFGSVVSDVAREVTAHGFVSLLKQFADFAGISPSNGAISSTVAKATAPATPIAHFG